VVEAEIRQLGLSQVYHLAGHLPDAQDFYTVFDAFCMSSAEEGLGSSVLDAFLCRVPVACTTAGGLAWLGAEGRAQQVPPHQPAALASALGLLLNWPTHQPDALAQQLDAAHRHAQTQHNLGAITAGYLEIYQKMRSA
jgi:glycosyltransferase involved in cell wall biosynthesis